MLLHVEINAIYNIPNRKHAEKFNNDFQHVSKTIKDEIQLQKLKRM